jgi:hypothetical protein
MNMKSFAILLLIFIAVVTIAVFLYSFSYNLALGQSNVSDVSEDEARLAAVKKAVDEQYTERRNMNVSAPIPILFDWEGEGPTPFPSEGQILIDISAYDPNLDSISWSGSMLYGDGDTTSLEGTGRDVILVDCADGNPYSVNFQMGSDSGHMTIYVYDYDPTELETNQKQIDVGSTEASYGVVGLTGTC